MEDPRAVSERLLESIIKQEHDLIENIGLKIFLITVVDYYGR